MKLINVYADQIKLFVIVNSDGIRINVDVNVKKLFYKDACNKGYFFNPSNCKC